MHELTEKIPKPLVSICGKPMLWHILKAYQHYGFHEFILLLGYKGEQIKDYFVNDSWKNHSFVLDAANGSIELLDQTENWKITFLDTGLHTMTGGRLKLAQKLLDDGTFMMTYGDGLSDINLNQLLEFHQAKKRLATVTGIDKKSQYGTLTVRDDIAVAFDEKEQSIGTINGGFLVLEPEVFRYLGDAATCVFEKEVLPQLAQEHQLAVYHHEGFWTACDTYSDIIAANQLCEEGKNQWKVW